MTADLRINGPVPPTSKGRNTTCMHFPLKRHESLEAALSRLDRKAADATALVLASQYIPVAWHEDDGGITLTIAPADAPHAWTTLTRFYMENRIPSANETREERWQPPHTPPPPINLQGKLAAAGAALVMCILHAIMVYQGIHTRMIHSHGASALYILQGEWARSITALMLHTDAAHLAANSLAMVILGSIVCSMARTRPGPVSHSAVRCRRQPGQRVFISKGPSFHRRIHRRHGSRGHIDGMAADETH